ncbi:hypothetical protein [Enterococcus mundtii]|uniref:DUF1310 domain-containing protein n=1 Tax=Enterococcus mundtii TaxID=53346 RepID=A0A2T5DBG9_ENTMU|nr:hypothetical protein [Enterococcus mundtii]PTO35006.1 hypothetical protein C6N14_09535 [Enterococcus mundtii]
MRKQINKRLVIGIAVLISLVMIGIGGKVYIDKREERKAQELLAIEKQSVQALKNTFADIAEVKFEGSAKNDITGSYTLFITIKSKKGERDSFSFSFWKEINEIGSYIINNVNVQKEGITKEPIHIVFSNNMEGKL